MRIKPALILIAACLINSTLSAEPAQVSKIPQEKMQALAVLTGQWAMAVSITEDDGKTWQTTPAQAVDIRLSHKGMLLEEVPQDLSSPGFHMHSLISYDQYRKVYRKAATDDVWGIMDMYEGNIEDEKLVLTNLKSKTYFPISENIWRGFRLTLELKPNHRTLWIEKTDDDGKTWQAAFKADYTAL